MTLKVVPVGKDVAEQFVKSKHYSRRASIFWAGFGLVENGHIVGVVVFGQPSPPIQRSAFRERDFRLYELARLVVQTKTKNAASFLIAGGLRQLEGPCAVVSYADSEWGHCGYVYQATNWIYTGATVSHDHAYMIDGKRVHPITLRDVYGVTNPKEWAKANGIKTIKPMPKHRYFYLVGDRRQRRDMLAKLVYPVIKTYPKCDPQRYDDGPDLVVSAGLPVPAATEPVAPRILRQAQGDLFVE